MAKKIYGDPRTIYGDLFDSTTTLSEGQLNYTELQKLYDRLHELKTKRDRLLGVDDIDSLSYDDKKECLKTMDEIDEVYDEIYSIEGLNDDVSNLMDDNDEDFEVDKYGFMIEDEQPPLHYYDNDQDFEIDTDF